MDKIKRALTKTRKQTNILSTEIIAPNISNPNLKYPISLNDPDVVKVILELPERSSQGLNNGCLNKKRDLIQFDLHTTLGLFAIKEELSKKFNVDMNKNDLLLVNNNLEKRYDF